MARNWLMFLTCDGVSYFALKVTPTLLNVLFEQRPYLYMLLSLTVMIAVRVAWHFLGVGDSATFSEFPTFCQKCHLIQKF